MNFPTPIRFFEFPESSQDLSEINEPEFDFQLVKVEAPVKLSKGQTHFGFVHNGEATLGIDGRKFPIACGMYFSVIGEATLTGNANIVVASQHNYVGIFGIGGPVEEEGRLKYIDGCSDTLLISPVTKGDACLNFLKLPPQTNQSFHTHPSLRFGIIFSGTGHCDYPDGTEPLFPGKAFFIPPDGEHRFRTNEQSLSVIAFHPDSDFGPHDDFHPMVNRTIVNGVPASQLSHEQRGISKTKANS